MEVLLVVSEGGFTVADEQARTVCRHARLRRNEVVSAHIHRGGNPKLNRLAHRFGQLCRDHLPGFEGLDAHTSLKKLMAESGVGCEHLSVEGSQIAAAMERALGERYGESGVELAQALIPYLQGTQVTAACPRSLSFASMDEAEFRDVFTGLAQYLASHYWPHMTPDEIAGITGLAPGMD